MKKDKTKARTEVTEESKERLEVLELNRTPRDEKMAREAAFLEGATEVHYAERSFRPAHRATLADVRARVDALAPTKRALPEPRPVALPPEPEPAPPPVSDAHRRALQPMLPAPLLRVEPVYSTAAGEVVAAYYQDDAGIERSLTFLVAEGRATPVEDVSRRVDELPEPAPQSPGASEPPAEKAGRFSFQRKKAEPKEAPKASRFPFGKRAKDEPKDAPPSPQDAPAEEPEKRAKRRFPFRKK